MARAGWWWQLLHGTESGEPVEEPGEWRGNAAAAAARWCVFMARRAKKLTTPALSRGDVEEEDGGAHVLLGSAMECSFDVELKVETTGSAPPWFLYRRQELVVKRTKQGRVELGLCKKMLCFLVSELFLGAFAYLPCFCRGSTKCRNVTLQQKKMRAEILYYSRKQRVRISGD